MDEVISGSWRQSVDIRNEDDVALEADSLVIYNVGEDRLHDDVTVGGVGHKPHGGPEVGVEENLLKKVEPSLRTLLPFW